MLVPRRMPATLDQRYEFRDEIGQGGMAVVYRGLDRKLGREVAIKVLRPDITANENIVKSFHSEAAATSKLSHPNIVSLHDFGELTDGRLYMVIELLHGKSLAQLLEDHRARRILLAWPRIVAIATQVCAALTAAHAHGIVHHDITPGNIFITGGQGIRGDHVKVLDFGIAKITEMTQAVTVATLARQNTGEELKGTPFYIAPELLLQRPTDHRVDIYGLGAVMYEMATNHRPFQQQNLYALLLSIASAQLIPPTAANPDCALSPDAEAAILAAMARDPIDRPQTADELARLLEDSLHAAPARDTSPRVSHHSAPAPSIGLDLTLPQSGPLPPLALSQPLPSLAARSQSLPPLPAPLAQPPPAAAEPAPTPAPTRPRTSGSLAPVAAALLDAEPASNPAIAAPPAADRPASILWKFGGVGLGLGLAILFGVVLSQLFLQPTQPTPSPTPDDPGPEPPKKTEPPPPPKKTKDEITADRRAIVEARIPDKTKMRACLNNADVVRGVTFALPIQVDIAADGRPTAKHDSTTKVPRLLPEPGHTCVLAPITAEPFPPAEMDVTVAITVTLEK